MECVWCVFLFSVFTLHIRCAIAAAGALVLCWNNEFSFENIYGIFHFIYDFRRLFSVFCLVLLNNNHDEFNFAARVTNMYDDIFLFSENTFTFVLCQSSWNAVDFYLCYGLLCPDAHPYETMMWLMVLLLPRFWCFLKINRQNIINKFGLDCRNFFKLKLGQGN